MPKNRSNLLCHLWIRDFILLDGITNFQNYWLISPQFYYRKLLYWSNICVLSFRLPNSGPIIHVWDIKGGVLLAWYFARLMAWLSIYIVLMVDGSLWSPRAAGLWYSLLDSQNKLSMMTSSNRNIFRVTDPLCGEFTGHRWIPRTKASDA